MVPLCLGTISNTGEDRYCDEGLVMMPQRIAGQGSCISPPTSTTGKIPDLTTETVKEEFTTETVKEEFTTETVEEEFPAYMTGVITASVVVLVCVATICLVYVVKRCRTKSNETATERREMPPMEPNPIYEGGSGSSTSSGVDKGSRL